jgi:beta-N-acetylhexosaminidase
LKTLLFFAALLGMLACGQRPAEPADTADTVGGDRVAAVEISLDEAIGEMLLVGFRGTTIDSTHHVWRDIRDYHVGSVILFDFDAPTGTRGRNIKSAEQVKTLCSQLHKLSPTLLIGIDQEGGRVSRLSTQYGFPAILSAQKSAEKGLDTVRHYARLTTEMLHELGINLNFAPVADVNVNPACPVIGGIQRSFSADTTLVTQCCKIWIDEQRSQGVASCLKHFPGHGSAKGDTHKGLVDVTQTWQRRELAPYRALKDCDMVMTAHVINRWLDPAGLPASLSPRITSLLRDSLEFQGVIVTDDLAMGAIAGQYSLEQTIRMTLDAGADLLCLSNNGGHGYDSNIVPKVVKIIKKLVADGTIDADRIYQSANRVRKLKEALYTTNR